MPREKRRVEWAGDCRNVLRSFPEGVKWVFGRALFKAESGERHETVSLMKGRLKGILEVADDDKRDTYRLYYTLKCPGYVYVLYGHKKKSKRGISIPKYEEDLILRRFKDAMIECRKERAGAQ